MKHIFGNYIEEEKTHATPLRNSSTISFCIFLVWDCNLELFPAMYLDFQLPYFGSNSFNRLCKTMAAMTLSTKTIHRISFKSLYNWNEENCWNEYFYYLKQATEKKNAPHSGSTMPSLEMRLKDLKIKIKIRYRIMT